MEFRRRQLWAALGLAACTAAASLLRDTPVGELWRPGSLLHRATHICVFALLGALFAACTNSWSLRCLLLAGVVLLGLGTEYYEHLRAGFPTERPDVLFDALGAGVGALAGTTFALLLPPRLQQNT